MTRPCGTCRGEGTIIEKACPACRGEGRQRASRKLEIRVPAGVETGSRLRLAGEGDVGANGGPSGDLYVVLTVAAHEVFEREENDVVLTLNLPYPTLVLGGEISVPTLEEKEKILVAPGTPAGSELRLRGKGFGRLGQRGRGDLVVRVNVAIPEEICLPAAGIYAGTFKGADGVERPTAISLGHRPTFYTDQAYLLLEAYLLDFSGDLYGQAASVGFVERIRAEQRFDSVEALVAAMQRDVEAARRLLEPRGLGSEM